MAFFHLTVAPRDRYVLIEVDATLRQLTERILTARSNRTFLFATKWRKAWKDDARHWVRHDAAIWAEDIAEIVVTRAPLEYDTSEIANTEASNAEKQPDADDDQRSAA
jgi:hypothetical protein